jgi:hypothetical protein
LTGWKEKQREKEEKKEKKRIRMGPARRADLVCIKNKSVILGLDSFPGVPFSKNFVAGSKNQLQLAFPCGVALRYFLTYPVPVLYFLEVVT